MDLLTIRTAAREAGVSVDSVRNYERQGLIEPIRDSAGRRLFTWNDVDLIKRIYTENMAKGFFAREVL